MSNDPFLDKESYKSLLEKLLPYSSQRSFHETLEIRKCADRILEEEDLETLSSLIYAILQAQTGKNSLTDLIESNIERLGFLKPEDIQTDEELLFLALTQGKASLFEELNRRGYIDEDTKDKILSTFTSLPAGPEKSPRS